ncbi:MAG: 1-acyl-sn-glycerol-3-phosphate acyltransferase [Spirochaetes bacterium]|nr:1-acyl-sn-glycerol-3-phosphate acyltransferase [Spirochaetota bacterium]
MDRTGIEKSLYIKNAMVETGANSLMGKIAGLFFRTIDFDSESLQTLKEYQSRGRAVYVSYQSANTPLMVLVNLLKRHGFRSPELALDFTPNILQMIANISGAVSMIYRRITGRRKFEKVSDSEYLVDCMRDNRAVVLSLLSRKQFIQRYIEIKSDTLEYLVEAQKLVDEPIYLFPQLLFWNQNPERTGSLVTSRATGDRGFFSGLFTVAKSSTPAFIRISEPLNIREEIENSPADDPKQIARSIRARLLEIYNNEKRTVLGPTLKSQQEMMERVLYNKNVLDEINSLVESERQSEKKLRKKAYRYFKEIAADFSILVIKWFNKAVQYMFTKIFDGINFNIDDLKRVREAAQRAPLILVPSHKSHMDYLIISSIFYENKIIPPHIVAGANLTFFPMGPVFRKSGAFFMRRSFRGLNLYPTIFRQYIKTLIGEGYSIEVFIEGTRTRTGKLALPKMGIISYLIEAIDEGYARDMIFVPITIGYDRILEESTYHMELKGKEKESESTSNFVKSRKFLKRKYGKVYLSFNEPFSFTEFREGLKEGEDLTVSLGNHIIRRIGDIIMATPFSVASSSMLLSSAKGFTRDILKKRINILLDYLKFSGVRMSDHLAQASNIDEIIDYVLDSYFQDGIVGEPIAGVGRGTGELIEGLYTLSENERSRINFYKNSIVHYFLPVSFVSTALLVLGGDEGLEGHRIGDVFADMMDLLSEEFVYHESLYDSAGSIAKALAFLTERGTVAHREGRYHVADEKRDELVLFAKAVQDFLESYLIVCDSVYQVKKRSSRKDLMYEVRKNGIKLFHLSEVKLTESLSMPNYENAITKLGRIMAIEAVPAGKKQVDLVVKDEQKVIEVKNRIERYLRPLQKL